LYEASIAADFLLINIAIELANHCFLCLLLPYFYHNQMFCKVWKSKDNYFHYLCKKYTLSYCWGI